MLATVPSMPILTASTPMSSATARTWATMTSGETASTALTPTVFWAVMAVIAVMPCTPQAANAFRSAWMPAPPPESEPAIDSTQGGRLREPPPVRADSAWAIGPSLGARHRCRQGRTV